MRFLKKYDSIEVAISSSPLAIFIVACITIMSCQSCQSRKHGIIGDEAGKGVALLVGLNKTTVLTSNGVQYDDLPTREAHTYVNRMQTILQGRGFSNIYKLTTENARVDTILSVLDEVASTVKEGDTFVFYFMGHGVQQDNSEPYVPCLSGEEFDERDEGIVVYNSVIIDDILRDKLKKFKKGVNVILMMDCCNAGTLTAIQGVGEEDNEVAFHDIIVEKSRHNMKKKNCINNVDRFKTLPCFEAQVLYLGASSDGTSTSTPKVISYLYNEYLDDELFEPDFTYCKLVNGYYNPLEGVTVAASVNLTNEFLDQGIFTLNN